MLRLYGFRAAYITGEMSPREREKTMAALRNRLYRLSPDATAYVSAVRASPPARQVTSVRVRNTLWRYASHKMHCSISAESSLEKAFLAHCEYDDDVIEYWDQPGIWDAKIFSGAVSTPFLRAGEKLHPKSCSQQACVDFPVRAYQ